MTETLESRIFSRFESMEYKMYDYENDVDPESYVFNQSDTCRYFTDDEINDNVKLNDTFFVNSF